MSEIGHINSSPGAGLGARDLNPRPSNRQAPDAARAPGREAQSPRREPDRIDLSPAAQSRLDDGIRAEIVVRAREEIVRGEYDTPERFEAAVDAMIDAIQGSGER
mgnify:CR=1 FL=1